MNPLSLIKRVAEAVFNALRPTVRTHIIGQVVDYDAAANTATIQPVLKVIRAADANNTTTVEAAPLAGVPVRQYGSGKLWATVAPAPGSYGELHASDRAIDGWMAAGGIVEPTSTRTHDISDVVFEPSIVPLVEDGDNGAFTVGIATDRISLRTRTGLTEVSVLADETIEVNVNDGTANLVIDVDGNVTLAAEGDISAESTGGDVTVTADGTVTTAGGTETALQAGTDYAVQYTALKAAFDQLKNELNALVTAYNAHIHITTATVGATPTPGVIAPTTSTGTPPTADMSGAKVNDVRVP